MPSLVSAANYIPSTAAMVDSVRLVDWRVAIPVLFVFTYFFGLVLYRLYLHPLAKYPGPFFARITNWYAVYHAYIGDKHLDTYRAHQKYGKFVRVAPNMLTINDVAAVKDIYAVNKNVAKSRFYQPAIEHSGGESSFNARDRQLHARKRRILAPAFTDHALASMEEYIIPHIQAFFKFAFRENAVQSAKECWTVDMGQWGNFLTFDVMADLAFGKDFGMLAGQESRELPAIIDAAAHRELLAGSSATVHRFGLDYVLFPKLVRTGKKLLKYAGNQAAARLQEEGDRKDFLYYLKNGKERDGTPSYKDQHKLFAECRTLIIGGSDTTATQLAANFFYLTNNPRILSQLVHETRTTFSDVEEIRVGDKLSSCVYLNAVVEETLRINPSVPGILPREVLPGGITVCDEFFPAGVELSVPIYTIHHNPKYYPEPHKHVPERWLAKENDEESLKLAADACNPFSYGSRMCVGWRLAKMELYLILARAMYLYDIEYIGGGREDRLGPDVMEYKLMDHLAAGRSGPVIRFKKA